jgi:cytochrome c-type biogenesis protein CcmF
MSTMVAVWERTGFGRNYGTLRTAPRGFWGMVMAHAGVGVFTIGVTLTSAYSIEKDVRLAPGESVTIGGYELAFQGVRDREGPNYRSRLGRVTAFRDGRAVATLEPEKRLYRVQQQPMTEAAIDAGVTRDLYVSLGEPLDGQAWSVRVYYKPFIRWIWSGALIMALGGLLAATDRRYRNLARAGVELPARVSGSAPSSA